MKSSLRHGFCFFLILAACEGGPEDEPRQPIMQGDASVVETEPGGPVFLDFGVSTRNVEDDPITFTAVVTDPDGIGDVVGGVLEDVATDTNLAAFQTSAQEGAYSLLMAPRDLSLHHRDFEGTMGEAYSFEVRAKFFDQEGKQATEVVEMTIPCESPRDLGGLLQLRHIRDTECLAAVVCRDLEGDGRYECSGYSSQLDGMTSNEVCSQLGLSCDVGACNGESTCASEIAIGQGQECFCQ